jgi:hypothetical protein
MIQTGDDAGFITHPRPEQRRSRARRQISIRSGVRVIRMGVRNHGSSHRLPRIYVEISRGTVKAFRMRFNQTSHIPMLKSYFLPSSFKRE